MNVINTVASSFVFPTNPWMKVLAGVQVLLVVVNGLNEYTNPTPYSKFASSSTSKDEDNKKTTPAAAMIPSRQGMVVLYAPSMITATCFIFSDFNQTATTATTTTMTMYLVWIHFTKRVLESLFLHKYSGGMERNAAVMIGTFYTLVSTLIIMTAEPWMSSEDISNDDEEQTNTRLMIQQLGLVMFVVGTIGNLYHHYLLRQLRSSKTKSRSSNNNNNYDNDKDKKKQRYTPPTGGLFDYVVAPHYLFEIVAFVGIACTSLSIHSLLVSLGMASYLTGRAIRTLKFYQDTFDKLEFSRETKALIPFIL